MIPQRKFQMSPQKINYQGEVYNCPSNDSRQLNSRQQITYQVGDYLGNSMDPGYNVNHVQHNKRLGHLVDTDILEKMNTMNLSNKREKAYYEN